MFISDTHLPQLIAPRDYTSPEQFNRENERLFLPAWHCVGSLSDLPRDGDFFTTKISDDAPPLAGYLGPLYETWRPLFADHWWPATGMDYEVAANWKIITENALESYHTDAVHPKTFGAMPREETCSHDVDDCQATFST